MSHRPYNFGAGPATLPEPVLQQVQAEFLDWGGTGMSILEIGHRTPAFTQVMEELQQSLRDMLDIPANYHVLVFTGPARAQFSSIPLNCLPEGGTAAYLDTGVWSHLAIEAAKPYGNIHCAASGKAQDYKTIPAPATWDIPNNASYFYFCDNETVQGLKFPLIPDVGNIPLVSDMTSTLLTAPIDVSRYGLIFAGAQKNIGCVGLTIVIVRNDLCGHARAYTPITDNYAFHAKENSMYYTANTFACYVTTLCLRWLKEQGGVTAMAESNARKSEKLYRYIDNSDFYYNDVEPHYRSPINIPFHLHDVTRDADFISQAKQHGLVALKGHISTGGMRANLYNAMPEAGVDSLIEFMERFAV